VGRELNPLEVVISKLRSINGVIDTWSVDSSERAPILRIEDSQSRTFVGLPIENVGLREVLQREFVICIKHSSTLRHPPKPILIIMADKDVVGEEVWEKDQVARFERDPNAIFLGKSFVLFRDRLNAAKGKTLRFVFESQRFPEIESTLGVCDVASVTVSPATDLYIKRKAGWDLADLDKGTVLVGFNSTDKKT
jgi:hypothetical protein